eukprot:1973997-Prymnesium_polylepis.1
MLERVLLQQRPNTLLTEQREPRDRVPTMRLRQLLGQRGRLRGLCTGQERLVGQQWPLLQLKLLAAGRSRVQCVDGALGLPFVDSLD